MIYLPDILSSNNPNVPLFLINSAKGFQIVDTVLERDAIPVFKRDLSYVVIVKGNLNAGIYSYIGSDITDVEWENTDNWELIFSATGEESSRGFDAIITVDTDVSPAAPYTYYRIDASGGPRTVRLPDPTEGCTDEYSVELHEDTHKVTITTVSDVAGAIEGFDSVTIPTKGTALKFKCDGDNGYVLVNDTRGLWSEDVITEDRDFTNDGFENNVIYQISPAIVGGVVNIILPPPNGLNDDKIIRASFVLKSEGTAVFSRSDAGEIGSLTTQVISKVDKGFTLAENTSSYSIIQDSRGTSANLLGINFYRLQEESDITGYRRLTTTKQDDDYSSVTLEEDTVAITTTSFVSILKYLASSDDTPDNIEDCTMQFNVTTRLGDGVTEHVLAKYVIFKLETDNITETPIAESSQFEIASTNYAQFTRYVDFPETDFSDGSRLGFDVQVRRVDAVGQDPFLTTKFEGSEPAYLNLAVGISTVIHNALEGRSAIACHPTGSINIGETFTTTVDWGEIPAGTKINLNDALLDTLKNAYAPYLPPSFTSFAIIGDLAGYIEVGDILTVSSATFTANNDTDGNPPSDITISGTGFNPATIVTIPSAAADLAPYTVALNSAGSESWTISGTDANSNAVSRVATRVWRWANKFGGSEVVVSDAATAQSVFDELNQKVLDTDNSYTFTCDSNNADASKYTYYMYPASYGDLSSAVQDGAAPVLTAFTEVGDFTITNDQGVSFSVKVYKSNATGAFADGATIAFS